MASKLDELYQQAKRSQAAKRGKRNPAKRKTSKKRTSKRRAKRSAYSRDVDRTVAQLLGAAIVSTKRKAPKKRRTKRKAAKRTTKRKTSKRAVKRAAVKRKSPARKKATKRAAPKAAKRVSQPSLAGLDAESRRYVQLVRKFSREKTSDGQDAASGYRMMLENRGVDVDRYLRSAKSAKRSAPKSSRSRRPGESFAQHMARLRKVDGR
jgi:hypothetical protein